jgi:hypothetical protein
VRASPPQHDASATKSSDPRNDFELKTRPAAPVKGVEEPITHYRVVGERVEPARVGRGPLVGRDRELGRLEKVAASHPGVTPATGADLSPYRRRTATVLAAAIMVLCRRFDAFRLTVSPGR